jgi:hypothetical protein
MNATSLRHASPPIARPVLALLAVVCAAPAVAQDDPAASGRWTGHVTPYVWGSGVSGRLTPFAGAPTVAFEASLGEVLEDTDAAFFMAAYARRDRFVLFGDYSASDSSKQGELAPGVDAEGRLRQSSLTLAAGWRVFEDQRAAVDVMGGFRHWSLRAAVDVPAVGLSRSPEQTFTDPLLAMRANVPLSPRWSLIAYADVGCFGGGSEHTHQWLLSANYLHGERWAFSLGLRQFAVDYRDGGTRVDVTLSGPMLGASWRF